MSERRTRIRVRDAGVHLVVVPHADQAMPVSTVTVQDLASATLTYVGTAVAGTAPDAAGWRIARVDESGVSTVITYPGGAATFTNRWDQRASLSYA